VNSRKWVRLFLTTLFLGGISTVIIGFVLEWDRYDKFFQNFDVKEIPLKSKLHLRLILVGETKKQFQSLILLKKDKLRMQPSSFLLHGPKDTPIL